MQMSFLPFAFVLVGRVMAQALIDLTYYKCGHCQKKFNSLAAFGKHHKELHTPKNAPKNFNQDWKKYVEQEKKKNFSNYFDFRLKVKLCPKCAENVEFNTNKERLEVPICKDCWRNNGAA